MKSHKEHLLLLLDHDGELSLLPCHIFDHIFILCAPLRLLQVLTLLFKFAHSDDVPFYLMLNDLHCRITDLIDGEEFMKLGEVRVGLEDV